MDLKLFPPGAKFEPNDQELLNYWLKPKVHNENLPFDIIIEKNIYGDNANPWDMLNDSSMPWFISGKFEKTVYVFTPLTKKAKTGGEGTREHYVKKAGCGTWHGETPREEIMDNNNNVIGVKRLLVFHINDVSSIGLNKAAYYKMHEYVLSGFEEYALCRITLDTSKNAKVVNLCPKRVSSTKSKGNKKTTKNRIAVAEDESKQVVWTKSCREKSVASTSSVFPYGGDQGIVKDVTSSDSFVDRSWSEKGIKELLEEVSSSKKPKEYIPCNQALESTLFEDFFDGGFCSDFSRDDVSLNSEDFPSEEDIYNFLNEALNYSNARQQPPMQDMSCSQVLGKRKSFETQEHFSGATKKLCK